MTKAGLYKATLKPLSGPFEIVAVNKGRHYQLSTQHRFVQGGKWVDSASIAFDVKPKARNPQ